MFDVGIKETFGGKGSSFLGKKYFIELTIKAFKLQNSQAFYNSII